MKAKLTAVFSALLVLFLAGCQMVPQSEQLTRHIKSSRPVEFNSDKTVYLTWHTGQVVPAYIPANASTGDGGVVGAIIGAAVASYEQSANKNLYELKYGKAKQVVLMTSLRDSLSNAIDAGFKKVILVANPPKQLKKDELVVDVHFTKTEVKSAVGFLPIVLDVTLSSTNNKQQLLFRKSLHAEEKASFWQNLKGRNFSTAQASISKVMLDKIIKTLEHEFAAKV